MKTIWNEITITNENADKYQVLFKQCGDGGLTVRTFKADTFALTDNYECIEFFAEDELADVFIDVNGNIIYK